MTLVFNYYPALNPTINNAYTLQEEDFEDDKTVCHSNGGNGDDSDMTATTYDSSEDDESSEDEPTAAMPQVPITMPTRAKAWLTTIQANNLRSLPQAATIFDPARVTRSVKHAISDSGATGHFLVENAPVTNKAIATNPITITLPNGKTIRSTHTCNLDIPWLPDDMTEAHIVRTSTCIANLNKEIL